MQAWVDWMAGCLLLSLRVAPVFAFAPPFTLLRLPAICRVLLAIGLAACLVSTPEIVPAPVQPSAGILLPALRELALGITIVLAFQTAFGALYFAGRTIDIQAGYGLALLIDPTSRAQTPLVGMLLAYAACLIFFAADGHLELVRLFAATLQAVPLGGWSMPDTIGALAGFMGTMFSIALGAAGAVILLLFLIDVVIALLSRTAPQMNVLVLGFQVKTIAVLLVLPFCLGGGGALLARMMAMMLQAIPRLV